MTVKGEHHHCHEHSCDGGGQDGRLAIDGVQDRERYETSVGHRRRHSIDCATGEVAPPIYANQQENQREAQYGAASECQQEAPLQKIAGGFLRDGDEQQSRHRDVVSEMHQTVGQRPRYVAEPPSQPAGDNDREHGKHHVGDFHLVSPLARHGSIKRVEWTLKYIALGLAPRG